MRKIIIIFIYLFMFNSYSLNAETKKVYKVETNLIDSTLSINNIYLMLFMNDIKYPEVVISQIMLETGYLTSKLCKANNNLLGMMVPSKRKTTATNKKGFAKYANWIDCILDYKLYQEYILSRNKIDTKKQYIVFLHKNYAKSPLYKRKLTKLSIQYQLQNPYNNL